MLNSFSLPMNDGTNASELLSITPVDSEILVVIKGFADYPFVNFALAIERATGKSIVPVRCECRVRNFDEPNNVDFVVTKGVVTISPSLDFHHNCAETEFERQPGVKIEIITNCDVAIRATTPVRITATFDYAGMNQTW